jgi:hypothetical protein
MSNIRAKVGKKEAGFGKQPANQKTYYFHV